MNYKTGESPQVGDWVEGGRFCIYPKGMSVSGVVVTVGTKHIQVADNNVGILDWGYPETFTYVRKATEQEIKDAA